MRSTLHGHVEMAEDLIEAGFTDCALFQAKFRHRKRQRIVCCNVWTVMIST